MKLSRVLLLGKSLIALAVLSQCKTSDSSQTKDHNTGLLSIVQEKISGPGSITQMVNRAQQYIRPNYKDIPANEVEAYAKLIGITPQDRNIIGVGRYLPQLQQSIFARAAAYFNNTDSNDTQIIQKERALLAYIRKDMRLASDQLQTKAKPFLQALLTEPQIVRPGQLHSKLDPSEIQELIDLIDLLHQPTPGCYTEEVSLFEGNWYNGKEGTSAVADDFGDIDYKYGCINKYGGSVTGFFKLLDEFEAGYNASLQGQSYKQDNMKLAQWGKTQATSKYMNRFKQPNEKAQIGMHYVQDHIVKIREAHRMVYSVLVYIKQIFSDNWLKRLETDAPPPPPEVFGAGYSCSAQDAGKEEHDKPHREFWPEGYWTVYKDLTQARNSSELFCQTAGGHGRCKVVSCASVWGKFANVIN